MTHEEQKRLRYYLDRSSNYFEYGCGDSTILASESSSISKIISIDSCLSWISATSNKIIQNKSIVFNYIDIDADDQKWGWPKSNKKKYNWPTYSSTISDHIDVFDTVLIDGRFRVACAMQCFHKINNRANVIIHDYNRSYYHIIENCFTKIDQVDSLCILQKKQCDPSLVSNIFNRYKFIPN